MNLCDQSSIETRAVLRMDKISCRTVKVGFITQKTGCESVCTEKIHCKHSEQEYSLMKNSFDGHLRLLCSGPVQVQMLVIPSIGLWSGLQCSGSRRANL